MVPILNERLLARQREMRERIQRRKANERVLARQREMRERIERRKAKLGELRKLRAAIRRKTKVSARSTARWTAKSARSRCGTLLIFSGLAQRALAEITALRGWNNQARAKRRRERTTFGLLASTLGRF